MGTDVSLYKKRGIQALILVGILLYLRVFGIWLYQLDDANLIAEAVRHYFHVIPFFRPLEYYTVQLNILLVGTNSTVVSHAVNLLFFAGSGWLVYRLYRLLFPKGHPLFALAAVLYFISRPQNVSSITDVDVTSQIASIFFVLLLAYTELSNSTPDQFRSVIVRFLLFLLAMFSKESSAGLIAVLPFATALYQRKFSWKRVVRYFLLFALVLVIYYLLNSLANGAWVPIQRKTFPTGHYSLASTAFIALKNEFMLFFANFWTGSTLAFVPRLHPFRIMIGAVLFAALAIWAIRGWLAPASRSNRPAQFALLLILPAATLPMALLEHVSELHSIMMAPFFAILLLSLVEMEVIHHKKLFPVISTWFVLTAMWGYWGIFEKTEIALRESARCRQIYANVEREIQPGDSTVTVIIPYDRDEPLYSIYYMKRNEKLLACLRLQETLRHFTLTWWKDSTLVPNYRYIDTGNIERIASNSSPAPERQP